MKLDLDWGKILWASFAVTGLIIVTILGYAWKGMSSGSVADLANASESQSVPPVVLSENNDSL